MLFILELIANFFFIGWGGNDVDDIFLDNFVFNFCELLVYLRTYFFHFVQNAVFR